MSSLFSCSLKCALGSGNTVGCYTYRPRPFRDANRFWTSYYAVLHFYSHIQTFIYLYTWIYMYYIYWFTCMFMYLCKINIKKKTFHLEELASHQNSVDHASSLPVSCQILNICLFKFDNFHTYFLYSFRQHSTLKHSFLILARAICQNLT